MVPESTFDDVVVIHSPLSPHATRKGWIVYSWRKKEGKGKLFNEVSSYSSSLLECEGTNEVVAFSLGQAQADGSKLRMDHLLLTVSKLRLLVKVIHGCWRILSFSYKRMGLAIEGRDMELPSFLASLESMSTKGHQFVDGRGRDQEEGGR